MRKTKPRDPLNLDALLAQTKHMALLDALSLAATWENERAVAQALRGVRDPHTGALWDTCFRYTFEAVLSQPRASKAWRGTAEDGSTGYDLDGRALVTFAADGDIEIVIRKRTEQS